VRKYLPAFLLAMLLPGCSGHHHGVWHDGQSFLYYIDDDYVLENGQHCGTVSISRFDHAYFAWVHGSSVGEWDTLEQAKQAVQSDWRCR